MLITICLGSHQDIQHCHTQLHQARGDHRFLTPQPCRYTPFIPDVRTFADVTRTGLVKHTVDSELCTEKMAKSHALIPPVPKVSRRDSCGSCPRVEDGQLHKQNCSPTSPPLNSKGFNEHCDDLRTKADTTQYSVEEPTQYPSNPEAGRSGARKRRIRKHEQDTNLIATNQKNLYTIVREDSQLTEEDRENLYHLLPSKIVENTQDLAQECVRRGDTYGACRLHKEALDKLRKELDEQKRVDDTPLNVSIAELLIGQGRRQEARAVLSRVHSPAYSKRTSDDHDYEKMMDMAEMELDQCRRAESWDKAREKAHILYDIEPSYFNLTQPMDRFSTIRRIMNAGVVKEAEARDASDLDTRVRFLSQALEIYNHGCHALEVFHEFFDSNETTLSGFDHSDCANIFFSAARICHEFDTLGHKITPTLFPCKGPQLLCRDWKQQALHFLETGRARSLLDTINRGNVVKEIRRRLIKKAITVVTEAARVVLKTRSYAMSSSDSSRTPSISHDIMLPNSDSRSIHRDGALSDSLANRELLLSHRGDDELLKLHTSNLSGPGNLDVHTSPAAIVRRSLTKEEESRVRVRLNWHRCLLWALIQVNPALRATLGTTLPLDGGAIGTFEDMRANIPSDTLVVEFALASKTPCGIMVVVATADAVEAVEWEAIDTFEIQRCIGDLRASMEISDDRMGPICRSHTTCESATRLNGPDRELSAVHRERLDELLRKYVVAPVQPYLEGKKQLIIVPSGDLAHVPWRIFFDLPITVVPSLSIWVQLHAQSSAIPDQGPNFLVVSTSPEDQEKKKNNEPYLRNIPFSRIEALHIARLHGQLPFLADDEEHKRLGELARDKKVVHICAHSTFESEAPISSSLQLFKEPRTIRDWRELSITADLVVFSSCLSGISRAFDSGSTIGFAHTILATGTKAFIGSLWRVDDRATLLLMAMFYEELRKPLPAVDALYEAQRRMRNLTDAELMDVIDRLEQAMCAEQAGMSQYVIHPLYFLDHLRTTEAEAWREERYWAAFVLTGYGSKCIYPNDG